MKNDAYSRDYGIGFYGYSVNTGTYIVNHPEFGWLAFGGNLISKDEIVEVTPTIAAKSNVFIAEIGLNLRFTAGTIANIRYHTFSKEVEVQLNAADSFTPSATLKLEQTMINQNLGKYTVKGYIEQNISFKIPLKKDLLTKVMLVAENTSHN